LTGPATRLRNQPLLLAEALLALALASLLIAVRPFRSIARLAAGGGIHAYPAASSTEAQLIGRAVGAWAERVPWRAVCFQQGLAALLMLRRRRRAATLFYGAAHSQDAAVVAHVWVQSASVDVIGCETAGDYGLLAAFPSLRD
jgi:Transglutaminase-like superfamily